MRIWLGLLALVLLAGCVQPGLEASRGFVEVKLADMSVVSDGVRLTLQDSLGRKVYISISNEQAVSIQQAGKTARPLTHDLMLDALTKMGMSINRIEIHSMKDGVYYADLIIAGNGKVYRLDARPSDCIALAVRTNAPIYINPNLFESVPVTHKEL